MAMVDTIKNMKLAGHGDPVWLVVSNAVEGLETLCEEPHACGADIKDELETRHILTKTMEFIEVRNM